MKKLNFSIKNVMLYGFVFGFALISINTSFVKAQTPAPQVKSDSPYTVLAPLPCIESPATENNPGVTCPGGNGSLQPTINFENYVQYTVNLLIGLSAVAAVVMIIWNGIEYMYSASFSDKKMSLEKAKNAVGGLVLIFTSYIILRTIDPRLVQIPNSLVPQIEVKSYLASDALGLLTNAVLTDVERTTIKGIENGQEMAKTIEDIKSVNKEIADLQNQISKLDKNSPEYKEIEVKIRKKQEEKLKLEIKRTILGAKGDFLGKLKQSQIDLIDGENYDTIKSKLQALNLSKAGISQLRDARSKTLISMGQLDIKPVNDLANYVEASIDINKIRLVIISSSRLSDSVKVIDMEDKNLLSKQFVDDGIFSRPRLTAREKAKAYIQKQIDRVQTAQNSITTDNEIKNDLQANIDATITALNSSSIFNEKKKE